MDIDKKLRELTIGLTMDMESRTYWVYILLCQNNTYYTGYTTDLERRYAEHVAGTDKCKYTRSFKPIAIACAWQLQSDKADALKVERYIKRLSKKEKSELVLAPENLKNIFAELIIGNLA